MTDDPLERRLREALASAPDPEEPRSLHAFLADVPTVARRRFDRSQLWASRPALAGLVAIVVVVAVGASVLLIGSGTPTETASPAPTSASSQGASERPTASSPSGIVIGPQIRVAEHPGSFVTLATSTRGPIVAVTPGEPATQAGKYCLPSDVAVLDASTVTWTPAGSEIVALAGDPAAAQPAAEIRSPDCSSVAVAPLDAAGHVSFGPASRLRPTAPFFRWKPADPSTVAFWVADASKGKGGFISWSTDGGATIQDATDAARPAGWDAAGVFWQVAPGGELFRSSGPGFSGSLTGIMTGVTWNATGGDVPIAAADVFAGRVLIAPVAGGLLSVGTDGSIAVHKVLDLRVSAISAGRRFVAVLGVEGPSDQTTLAISNDGEHFASAALPADLGPGSGPGAAVLALDDRVLLTSQPRPETVAVWSIPISGAGPQPIVTPAPTTTLPPMPSPALTSTWTPAALPEEDAGGVGGPAGGVSVLPGGGFIYFAIQGADRTDVFTSRDGSHWVKTGEVTGVDAAGITGPVAYDGRVYVALGSEGGGQYYGEQSNGAAWVSSDLRHWTKAPHQQAFGGVVENSGIAAGPAGFVAIGYARSGQSVRTSPDGLHWTVVVDERLFPNEQAGPTAVVRTADGLLMVGRVGQEAVSWTSTDGRHWTLHRVASYGSGLTLMTLAQGDAGYVSLASGGPAIEVGPGDFREPVTPWVSADGQTWQAGPPSAALFGAYASIVALPGGYVAADVGGAQPGLWTSANGVDWVPVGGVDLAGVGLQSLISDGHHALLIGTSDAGQVLLVCDAVHD